MGNNRLEITLVPFTEKFITEDYIGWLNDSNLMQFSEQRHKKHTFETSYKYYLSFKESENTLYAIIKKRSGDHVGNINAYNDINNGVADIGIIIGKPGHGYGYLAWMEMIRILFSKKRIRKISAGAMLINEPMIKIFKKSNMEYEYTKKSYFIYNEQYIDLVGYCLFK